MKRTIALVLTVAMMLVCLAGCSSGGNNSNASSQTNSSVDVTKEEVTIRFDWWGGDARHEATQKAVAAFMEKYPNIKVEVNFGAWKDWESARALEYQSGTGSDLTQIGSNWIIDYDKGGSAFVDMNTLSAYFDLTQYDQSVLDMCKDSAGGLAGIPIALTGRTFYWNKTTFDKAGIETPKTYQELLDAGKTFQEKLGDDYYPLELSSYDRALLMSFYLQANTGEPIIDQDGKLTVTQEQLVDGVKFIQNLEDNHVIPTIAQLHEDGDVALNENPKFIDGRYAGVFEWDTAITKYTSNLAEGQELVVGTELSGFGDKCLGVSSKVSQLFSITTSSKHPEAAATLMNYLLNDPEGVTLMATQRGIPASKAAYDTLEKAGMIDEQLATAHASVMDSNPLYFSPRFDNPALKDEATGAYNDAFEKLSSGTYTPEQAASVLYEAYTEVLSK